MMGKNTQVVGDHYRFTVITTRLIRLEYDETGQFEDGTTQAVIDRAFAEPSCTVTRDQQGFAIQIDTTAFHLYYRGGEFNGANLFIDYKYNYQTHYSRWHYGDPVHGNLGGTARTLDGVNGATPLGDGIISKDGFAILDDSDSMLQSDTVVKNRTHHEIDLYGFAYGHDYEAALRDYFRLTGFPPLVPRFALGNWWSRFYPYTQDSYLALMQRFTAEKIPISVAVLDMNWHTTDLPAEYGSGWTGYTWNKQLFPDHVKLLQELHRQGKRVTLNVHPAAGIRPGEDSYNAVAKAMGIDPATKRPVLFELNDPKFMQAYFDLVHHPLEDEGVDFWWVDWQQGGARAKSQVDPLWTLNVLHYEDQVKRHGANALTLSRFGGPGSQRYPLGFSGDTEATWDSLAFQPYFTATATNIGYTWWSHDIGGHMKGYYDPELSLRWLEFGVFSPIMRLHSSDNPFMGKEPWNYDLATQQAMTHYLQLRAQLVPYLETANILTHREGDPLIKPLYYGDPDNKATYKFPNEYYFGSQLLIAPITAPSDPTTGMGTVHAYLPAGTCTDFFTGQRYTGPQELTLSRKAGDIPVLVKSGGIVPLATDPMARLDDLPRDLTVRLYPGETNSYTLEETNGQAFAATTLTWTPASGQVTVKVADPAGIIPADRQWRFIAVGGTTPNVSGVANAQASTQALPTAQLLSQDLLQHAKIGFDLKKQLWQALTTLPREKALLTVQSLAPAELAGPLVERLLNDETTQS